jgi:hypothetical protein
MRRLLALLVVPVLVLAACGDDDEGVRTDPGDGADGSGDQPDPDPGAAVPGGGPDGLVLSIESVGGFTTPETTFRQTPTTVIYDDGSTVTQGAVMAIYPGPAVLPLVAGQIDDEALARIVALADEAGLLGDEPDVGSPPVADAPDTRITLVADGEAHTTVVPALGFDEPGAGVSDEQAESRARIQRFVSEVSELVTAGESSDMVRPDRYRVLPVVPVESEVHDVEPNELDWPLDVELVEGECTPITGDDVAALEAELAQATEITRWAAADGTEWRLAIRPVLPHEPDC